MEDFANKEMTTEHLAVCQSCAAALLLVSVTITAIQRNLQSTANASGRSDALAMEVCDQASLPGAPAAGSEPAACLRLRFNLLDGACSPPSLR
jgi:hypothetical protein